ncbi:MAG: HU family DNA-binding protein [Paludibacteraceae bacterium]|nr:HU family DNA-binding protein [Paludibacteraceae bacterium]MBQ8722474.1 HU family DNA-binding protein [Paludibacteraceae bacterium]
MNRTELVAAVAEKTGMTKVDAKKAVDAALEAIEGALVANEQVALLGFGTFSVAERAERQGVNPATGAKITIAAKKSVKFKAGSALNAKL